MPGKISFKSIIIIVVILVITVLGVGYFVTLSQWNAYTLAKSQLATVQKDSDDIKQAQAALDGFLNSYKTYQSDVEKVSLALPLKSSDLTNYISIVGDLAKSSGVALSSFSIEQPSGSAQTVAVDNSIQTITVGLTAKGSFASFKDFILHLENDLRITEVGNVSLKGAENGMLQYQISLRTFYQK